ncbi:hypothetical protein DLAC_11318 [Tieghemostelium lacteum]|uniref:Peptidase C1A papain C-terminal domain-containing protein n=1 Tax=Tieghemostelium lacteum TaxID=361077 RepID=A0A151Z458_TIELA|nr:hypothetical protein DLAC_11318 [Tieghemostelium lacteum]|eukprot:KYQ88584.1 hypothetical protein DLAC_11318 [Tieghemostelium lacteum]
MWTVETQYFPISPTGCGVISYSDQDKSSIPETFDARDNWSDCTSPIRTQAGCGSCWAQVSSGVYADRLCVASNETIKQTLSPQYLIDCSDNCRAGTDTSNPLNCNNGCYGGYIDLTLQFINSHGIVNEQCYQYEASENTCPSQCGDGTPIDSVTLLNGGSCNTYASLSDVQLDIMKNGPVIATFTLYQQFKDYDGGVFSLSGSPEALEGHAARVIGWGVDNGVPYWTAANSWGSGWGEHGFFRIRRNTNELGFEKNFISTTVDVSSIDSKYYGSSWNENLNSSNNLLPPTGILFMIILFYLIIVPIIASF